MTVKDFFDIVEMRTKAVSVFTLLCAYLWVFCAKGYLDPMLTVLFTLAALLVDMGTTGFNTWFDYWNGTDSIKWNQEEAKVLVHKGVDPAKAFKASAACFLLALIPGAALAAMCGPWLIPAGLVCMLAGFLYTGGPWPISRSPLGEFFAGGFLGGVLFLLVLGAFAISWTPQVLFAALPLTFWIGAILAFNNLSDRVGDQASGRKTFAVLAGPTGAVIYAHAWFATGILAMALLPLLAGLGMAYLVAAFCAAVLTLPVFVSMARGGYSHARKGPVMQGILKCFMIAAALFAVATLAARFLTW